MIKRGQKKLAYYAECEPTVADRRENKTGRLRFIGNLSKDNMEKINYFFRSENTILAKSIIESFLRNFQTPIHFILYFSQIRNEQEFVELFEKYNYKDYEFWIKGKTNTTEWMWFMKYYVKHPLILLHLSDLKLLDITLMYRLFHFSASNLILHCELCYYYAYVMNHVKYKLGWVCWGNIPAISRFKMPFLKNYIINSFVKKCTKILCLSLADERIIKERFSIHSTVFCPYLENFGKANIPIRTENKILVGNSLYYMDTYLDVAKSLNQFSSLDITFLCAYGPKECYEENKRKIRNILSKSKVQFWEDKVNFNKYIERIRTYSVYICNVKRQTGIGACNACIDNGIKLYLTGGNYEHYTKLGIKVYDFHEQLSEDNFFELSNEVAEKNRSILRQIYGKEMFVKRYTDVIKSFQY